MANIKEKLSNARELCPGMSEDMYLLTDYMASNADESMRPEHLMLLVIGTISDLETGGNGFAGAKSTALPQKVFERRSALRSEMSFFPQIVDAIAEEYSSKFREEWRAVFNQEPPKRFNVSSIKTEVDYPAYVTAAVDWWLNAIMSSKFDAGIDIPDFIPVLLAKVKHNFSEEQVRTFKSQLSEDIFAETEDRGYLELEVDYQPCVLLAKAGSKIGLNPVLDYPVKSFMIIEKQKIEARHGYSGNWEVVWKA